MAWRAQQAEPGAPLAGMGHNGGVLDRSRRRLAAIVVTDIVGFAAKAQEDESSALKLLRRHAELMEPKISEFGGRIVKSLGDGYLAEFASALDAVACSAAIQAAVAQRSAEVDDPRDRFSVRIGVHIGDVEFNEGDILGDGVNIASRLHRLAEPGGVCVSEDVVRQVGGRRDLRFVPLGAPPLKHIRRAIELYSMVLGPGLQAPKARDSRSVASIAVLPFSNLSSDPENEHFCDGLADELINALTRIPRLRVVSRTSSFAFKGRRRSLREMGEILDVAYIVEGSVRKAGNRIRVTAQVIDVASDSHLWSEQYDRELSDIFAIQADLTGSIASALEIAITPEVRQALSASGTSNVNAFELYLQGIQQYWRFSIPGLRASRSLFREAIELDPQFARAYFALVQCAAYHFFFWGDRAMLDDARWAANEIERLEPTSASAATAIGLAHMLDGRLEQARERLEEATRRDPMNYDAWYALARCRFQSGQYGESVEAYERAGSIRIDDFQCLCLAQVACRSMGDEPRRRELAVRALPILARHRRLHPDDPRAAYFEASVHTVLGDSTSAARCLRQAISLGPTDPSILYNAACVYCLMGMQVEAIDCLERTADAGFVDHQWMENDMDLRGVRDDPRFQGILDRIRQNRIRALLNGSG